MASINFKTVEEKATYLFGDKAVVSFAQARVGNKGYIIKINVQGLPFELSASAENIETAMEEATEGFLEWLFKARAKDLFKTYPEDEYEKVQLSDEELDKLYRFEDFLSDEYLKKIKEETTVWVCQLRDQGYECVIESPYKNLHSRGVGSSKQTAIMSAIWKARDIFSPRLIKVGEDILR